MAAGDFGATFESSDGLPAFQPLSMLASGDLGVLLFTSDGLPVARKVVPLLNGELGFLVFAADGFPVAVKALTGVEYILIRFDNSTGLVGSAYRLSSDGLAWDRVLRLPCEGVDHHSLGKMFDTTFCAYVYPVAFELPTIVAHYIPEGETVIQWAPWILSDTSTLAWPSNLTLAVRTSQGNGASSAFKSGRLVFAHSAMWYDDEATPADGMTTIVIFDSATESWLAGKTNPPLPAGTDPSSAAYRNVYVCGSKVYVVQKWEYTLTVDYTSTYIYGNAGGEQGRSEDSSTDTVPVSTSRVYLCDTTGLTSLNDATWTLLYESSTFDSGYWTGDNAGGSHNLPRLVKDNLIVTAAYAGNYYSESLNGCLGSTTFGPAIFTVSPTVQNVVSSDSGVIWYGPDYWEQYLSSRNDDISKAYADQLDVAQNAEGTITWHARPVANNGNERSTYLADWPRFTAKSYTDVSNATTRYLSFKNAGGSDTLWAAFADRPAEWAYMGDYTALLDHTYGVYTGTGYGWRRIPLESSDNTETEVVDTWYLNVSTPTKTNGGATTIYADMYQDDEGVFSAYFDLL